MKSRRNAGKVTYMWLKLAAQTPTAMGRIRHLKRAITMSKNMGTYSKQNSQCQSTLMLIWPKAHSR
jgi:hypothetical protein